MESHNSIPRLLSVYLNPQTYRNFVYQLISLPLAIVYLVVIVAGFSTGTGLLTILIGLGILMPTAAFVLRAARFERTLLNSLLGADIPQLDVEPFQQGNLFQRFWTSLTHPGGVFWRSLLYLILHGFVTLVGFVTATSALMIPFTLIVAPLFAGSYELAAMNGLPAWTVLLATPIGLVSGIILLTLNNYVMRAWRAVGRALLTEPGAAATDDAYGERLQSAGTRLASSTPQSRRDADKLRALLAESDEAKAKDKP